MPQANSVPRGGWTSTCMAHGLYARVWENSENSGMQLFFFSKVKVSNFKQPLLGSVKVREVF